MDIEGEATYFESDEGDQSMKETQENVSCTCACRGSSRYCGVLTTEDIRNYSWMTSDAAYECYVSYAKSVGFGVRKGDAARGKNGKYRRRRFFCNKAGHREEKYYNNPNRKKEHKAETRTGCEAKLSIYLDESSLVWRVRKLLEEHNHELIPQFLVHLIPNHRRLTDANKAQTDTMIMHGLPTSQIMGYLVGQAGGYHRVGFSKKDLDDYIERSRRARIIGGDSNATIGYLSGKADLDPMAMARYSSTPKDRLGNLFWADGMSRADYQLFGDVLAFDTTYRKNKYKKPLVIFSGSNHHRQTCIFGFAVLEDESGPTYTWLLKNFLDVMLGKSPAVVVTDGDEGMKEGIVNAFPNATHRLCGWHLLKNATSNIKDPTFCSEFKKCMYGKWHPDEFELHWVKMVDTFGLQNNDWVNTQYVRKENWASSYLMDKFCAGFRTTSRCEGINNYVKTFINSHHCLLDLVTNLERAIRDYRNNEMVAQFKTIYGEPVLTTGLTNLERSAAEAYTKEIYGLVKKEIQAVVALELIEDRSISTTMIYKVYHHENRDRLYTIMYDRNDKNIECECKRWNSEGIPCRHMFCVMKREGCKEIPEKLILKRWTKRAKQFSNETNVRQSEIKKERGFLMRYAALSVATT